MIVEKKYFSRHAEKIVIINISSDISTCCLLARLANFLLQKTRLASRNSWRRFLSGQLAIPILDVHFDRIHCDLPHFYSFSILSTLKTHRSCLLSVVIANPCMHAHLHIVSAEKHGWLRLFQTKSGRRREAWRRSTSLRPTIVLPFHCWVRFTVSILALLAPHRGHWVPLSVLFLVTLWSFIHITFFCDELAAIWKGCAFYQVFHGYAW